MDNRLGARAAETARVRVNGRTVPRRRARLEAHSRNRWFQVLLRRELARTVAGNSSVKLLDLFQTCDASASAIVAHLVPADYREADDACSQFGTASCTVRWNIVEQRPCRKWRFAMSRHK